MTRARLPLGLLLVLLLASLPFLVHPWYDATNDGSMYLASARSLLRGEGYSFLGEPFRIRPPGLAVLLAPLVAIVEAGGEPHFRAMNTFIALFGVVACGFLFQLLRPRVGAWSAFGAALVLWLNPGFQRSCNQIMSDAPGIAFLLGALLFLRWAERKPSLAKDVGLGLLIAVGAYVRSINVLLVPAVLVARVLSGRGELTWTKFALGRLGVVPAVVFALMLPWNLRNSAAEPPPPADQTFLYSYSSGMWHEDAGDPRSPHLGAGEILARVPTRTGQLTEVLGSRQSVVVPSRHRFLAGGDQRKSSRPRETSHYVIGTLFLIALAGAFFRRRGAIESFSLGAVCLLSVYFGFDDRLVLPVFVIAIIAVVDGLHGLGVRFLPEGKVRAVLAATLLCWAWFDFRPREDWDLIERQHGIFTALTDEARAKLPGDALLGALVGWHYGAYLDRPVHSLNWAIARAGKDPSAAEELIDRYGLNTILLSPKVPTDRLYMGYFMQRYAGKITRLGEGVLVRVRL